MQHNDLSIQDLAVIAALDKLEDEQDHSAVRCMEMGDDAGARIFSRALTAYKHAREYYQDGVRPDPLSDGRFQLQRPGGGRHIVNRDGRCSCKAGASMHWPIAMIIGVEVAGDYLEGELVGEIVAAPEPSVVDRIIAPLGERLARARADMDECYAR